MLLMTSPMHFLPAYNADLNLQRSILILITIVTNQLGRAHAYNIGLQGEGIQKLNSQINLLLFHVQRLVYEKYVYGCLNFEKTEC